MVDPVTDGKYEMFGSDDRAFLARMFAENPKIEANFEKYLGLPMQERFSQGQQDMKVIPRSGLVEWGVSDPKTLAKHTSEVVEYAVAHAPAGMDKTKIRIMATLHDLPEVIMTDFTPRANITSADKTRLEQLALAVLTDKQRVKGAIAEYSGKSTPLAQWVSDADKLVMLLEVLQCEAMQPELMEKSYWPVGDPKRIGGMFKEFVAFHAPRIKSDEGKELRDALIANADQLRQDYKDAPRR